MKKLKKILLVDDDSAINQLNKLIIERLGAAHHIEIVGDGKQALDYILSCEKEHLPDLILLDIVMPVMGGFEFLEQYEKLFKKDVVKSITLLTLSSAMTDEDRLQANQFKTVSGHIAKPLSPSRMEKLWRMHFDTD